MLSEQSLRQGLRNAWLSQIGSEDAFPRKILFTDDEGIGRKFVCADFQRFCDSVLLNYGRKNIYVAVYSQRQKEDNLVDRIFIDLDSETDLNLAYLDMQKISKFLPSVRIFTGAKGFAIYFKFPEIQLKHPREDIREFVKSLERELGLVTVDWRVVGDTERVSRLIFTPNLKPNKEPKMCIPINPEWSLEEILSRSTFCKEIVPVEYEISDFVKFLLVGNDENYVEESNVVHQEIGLDEGTKFKEELEEIMKVAPRIVDGRHKCIFQLIVPRMILAGASDVAILEYVKAFIQLTPDDPNKKSLSEYVRYTKRDIENTRKKIEDGEPIRYSFQSFVLENPEMLEFFSGVEVE